MMMSVIMPMLVPLMFAAGDPAVYYVSPDGKDTNPGTEAAPFATVTRARDAVRNLAAGELEKDVQVYLRGGVHFLSSPLVLGVQDSGTALHPILYASYPGEEAVISGGQVITGWTRGEGNQWQATLPEVKKGSWEFRQLFRDGERLPRGRYPNGDELLTVAAVNEEATEIEIKEALPGSALVANDAELVMYQNWSISRGLITSREGQTLRLQSPMGWMGHGAMTTASPDKPCYIENALAYVDAPGEWYLDRKTGVLTYQAAEGEDPNTAQFVAPRAERLLWVVGRPDAPVRNVRFSGITFAYSEWPLPDFGYNGIQAGHYGTAMKAPAYVLPAAIELVWAHDCQVAQCRIMHTGASGIALGAGCRRSKVVNCALEDIGGNGVMVGRRGDLETGQIDFVGEESLASDWEKPEEVPVANEVRDCTLRICGAVNHGCVGIFDAFCAATVISHNEVSAMPYTGISIGFRWDESKTSQSRCQVEYNHVFDVMKRLADGGAIYTLGLQPGTVLKGNLLHGVHRSAYAHGGAPNNGIFFDQGSKWYLVEGNIIYDTSGDPVRFNQTSKENLTWKDNSFGVSPEDPAFPKDAAKQAGPR